MKKRTGSGLEIKPKLKFDEPVPVDFAVKHNRYRAKTRIHPDRARFFELRGQAPLSVVVDAVLENCSLEEVTESPKKGKAQGNHQEADTGSGKSSWQRRF